MDPPTLLGRWPMSWELWEFLPPTQCELGMGMGNIF